MAGIATPPWYTLKGNLKTILAAMSTAEKAVEPAREFLATRDRWRPWIAKQQDIAMVNVMVDGVQPAQAGSGSRHFKMVDVSVNLDMYVLGTHEEQDGDLSPADEVAAARLDLLTAQVLSAILRKDNQDLGFSRGTNGEQLIGMMSGLTLQIYPQEDEQATGQYAPARWSFTVGVPFIPQEGPDLPAFDELNIEMKQLLESWGAKFTYPPSGEGA
jgi:hypothetical protein